MNHQALSSVEAPAYAVGFTSGPEGRLAINISPQLEDAVVFDVCMLALAKRVEVDPAALGEEALMDANRDAGKPGATVVKAPERTERIWEAYSGRHSVARALTAMGFDIERSPIFGS